MTTPLLVTSRLVRRRRPVSKGLPPSVTKKFQYISAVDQIRYSQQLNIKDIREKKHQNVLLIFFAK